MFAASEYHFFNFCFCLFIAFCFTYVLLGVTIITSGQSQRRFVVATKYSYRIEYSRDTIFEFRTNVSHRVALEGTQSKLESEYGHNTRCIGRVAQ